jgi:peptidoglycan hydrolase-like protein with peptidoglycan-binding domain
LTVRSSKVCVWIALALAGTLFFPFHAGARDKAGNGSAAKQASLKKDTAKPAVKGDSQKKVSLRSRRRSRRASYRYRLARLRLEPQRVEQIQRALIQAGYLNQEPTGRWDDPTRNAMRRYQADHGFPTTGLPEAKSLMKLGLGPHPLPEDCDPMAQARAGIEPIVQPETTPTQPPSSNASPQEQ